MNKDNDIPIIGFKFNNVSYLVSFYYDELTPEQLFLRDSDINIGKYIYKIDNEIYVKDIKINNIHKFLMPYIDSLLIDKIFNILLENEFNRFVEKSDIEYRKKFFIFGEYKYNSEIINLKTVFRYTILKYFLSHAIFDSELKNSQFVNIINFENTNKISNNIIYVINEFFIYSETFLQNNLDILQITCDSHYFYRAIHKLYRLRLKLNALKSEKSVVISSSQKHYDKMNKIQKKSLQLYENILTQYLKKK